MAEMTALTATIYREYQTSLVPEFQDASPGITARVELFYDDRFPVVKVSYFLPIVFCGVSKREKGGTEDDEVPNG